MNYLYYIGYAYTVYVRRNRTLLRALAKPTSSAITS